MKARNAFLFTGPLLIYLLARTLLMPRQAFGYVCNDVWIFGCQPSMYHAVFNALSVTFLLLSVVYFAEKIQPKMGYWSALIFSMQPLILHLWFMSAEGALAAGVLMWGSYLLINDNPLGGIAALAAIHHPSAIFMLALLGWDRKKQSFYWTAGIGFVLWMQLGVLSTLPYGPLLFDLGGYYSIGVFTLIIGLTGLTKKETIIAVLGLLALSMYDRMALIYAALFLSVGCAQQVHALIESHWTQETLKQFTVLLIVCGIAFSMLSSAQELASEEPGEPMLDVLEYVKALPDRSTVLSAPAYAQYITTLGGKGFSSGTRELLDTYDIIYAQENLHANNITHILVTPEMRRGLTWQRESSGLHYLLSNQDTFTQIVSEKGYTLYIVRKV